MFKNYIKIALRNIARHKGFSLINILGLAIGMACCILILLWVQDELSFDKHHENFDRISRVLVNVGGDNKDDEYLVGVTPAALGPNLRADFPEMEKVAMYKNWGNWLIKYKDEEYIQASSGAADGEMLDIFTIPLLQGDKLTALEDPHSLILNTEVAEKLFGDEDPIGKVVQVKDRGDFKITGIMDKIKHSHFSADFFFPFELLREEGQNIDEMGKGSYNFTTYVLLNHNASFDDINQRIKTYIYKFADPGGDNSDIPELFMQQLNDIYLKSHFHYDFTQRGDMNSVIVFSIIAVIVLLIACINFMNLTTARSANRAKEIGMRKVSGANRQNIIMQFFGESIMLAFLGLIIASVLVFIILPHFNNLASKELSFHLLTNIKLVIGLIGIALLTGILSGIYPAFYLSSFQPALVLKGSIKSGSQSSRFRQILVIMQFSLSIILIIATITISQQLKFIKNKNLGYNKSNMVYFRMPPECRANYDVLKNKFLQNPNITNVTSTRVLPVYALPGTSINRWDGKVGEESHMIHIFQVNFDAIETFEMEMVSGRSFSKNFTADTSNSIMINETAAKVLGMTDPVGKNIYFGEDDTKIIGVVKDFNFNTVRNKIEPLVITIDADEAGILFARISSDDIAGTMAYIEKEYKAINPNYSFDCRFFDETLDRLYRSEQRAGKLVTYFAFLAIFVSSLGLFGLASFMAEKRTKEIGIRKVLGASIVNIILLLSREFSKWVLLANIIAWPVAYFSMNKWLQNFAYRININYGVFFLAAIIALIIALLTVSYQSLKASTANPVKALKYE